MQNRQNRTEDGRKRKNRAKELKRRKDPLYQEKKNQRRNERRQRNGHARDMVRQHNAEKHRQRMVDQEYKRKKNISKDIKRSGYSSKVKEYEAAIKKGHDNICVCCGQLFADIGIFFRPEKAIVVIAENQQLAEVLHVKAIVDKQFCTTCYMAILKKKVPRMCLANGLDFPSIPEELRDLSPLEQRLVSARIPFMQLRELRPTTQLGMRGNIVNVPIDIEQSVNILPRDFDKTSTIQLAFKRRLRYKGSYIKEWIRPYKVFKAAEFLVNQPLYKDEGIGLAIDFFARYPNGLEEFVVDNQDKSTDEEELPNDDWDETKDDEYLNPEDEQTLLKEAIPFAPGEGHTPKSILGDEFVEELSFPAIYCGHRRKPSVKLSYHDIAKSEIRRYDRRCCDPIKLFFMFRKKQMIALNSAIQIYLKMAPNQNVTVQQALDQGFIESLVRKDEAYKVLSNDRTSPVYWSLKKRELMAMIRTLGLPTFFLTLSAAETRWSELLIILTKVLEGRTISEEEVEQMSWEHKCNLIRKDPVTCARYFDRRIRELFKLIRTIGGPFGSYLVEDYYIRIEFQHRGSPHVHSLLWLKDAPKYDRDNPQSKVSCEKFIHQFISCQKTQPDLKRLYELQFHKHTATCKRLVDDEDICRFGIPYFPMPKTVILEPVNEEDLADYELDTFPKILDKIKEYLSNISSKLVKGREDMPSFEDFLSNIGLQYIEYEKIIRSTLKRPKVFLRRGLGDLRTNAFNEEILSRHRANMDLQFVLDPYACVHYILDYINKSNRGMSRLLRQVVEEQKQGCLSHRQKLYQIASKFINSTEVSAQEAVYILLSIALSTSSRSSIFINTGPKDERVRRFRSEKELKDLDPDSTEVIMDGLLEHYSARPDELEDVCLAEFASEFELKNKTDIEGDPDRVTQDKSKASDKEYSLKNSKTKIIRRRKPKIIRYRRYQIEKEPLHFFREKLMLFVPWRDEDLELVNINHQAKYEVNLQTIMTIENQFVKDSKDDYCELEKELSKETREELDVLRDDDEVADEFAYLNLRSDPQNFDEEICETSGTSPGTFLVPKVVEDHIFEEMISSLNQEQRHFALGLLHHVKTTDDAFRIFLTGGAGTGKSVTVRAVYQTLTRWFTRHPDCRSQPDLLTVLLVGPTGKSAFHIGGTTIHSAFGIPVTQNKQEMKPMSAELKNKFRNRLWNLKVIIIDEVSMVGAGTLQNIHRRLIEIFERDEPFAGKSILFVGDFNQLKPVMDSYVFRSSYGSSLSSLAGPVLWQHVKFYRLNIIMRQKDDLRFAEALNNLATGNLREEDEKLFRLRLFPKTSLLLPSSAIRLFKVNEKVDRYNQMVIKRMDGQVFRAMAVDRCNHPMKKVRDSAIGSIANLKSQKTYGLAKYIELKVGVRYMVSINIDIEDGLVNGSSGWLRSIDSFIKGDVIIIQRLWLEFDYSGIGRKAQSQYPNRENEGKKLTPIQRIIREIPTKTGSTLVRVSRCQFPLVVCEAISIHKSQGQSYDQVVVDVSHTKDLQLLYTAMSRARNSNGLFLVGEELIFPSPRPDNHPISIEMARLEREANWDIPLPLVSKLVDREGYLVIGYQNLPYLAKHKTAVSKDHNLAQCDFLCFVETYGQAVHLDGFSSIAEMPPTMNSYGINIYSRNPHLEGKVEKIESLIFSEKAHIEFIWISLKLGLEMIILYSSPRVPKDMAIEAISEMVITAVASGFPLIIMGDFNIQLESPYGQSLVEMMALHGLSQLTKAGQQSTDYRTQIDLVFANIPGKADYYESTISDHKPVICILKSNQ